LEANQGSEMTFGGKDNRGPSIAELQRYIRDQIPVLFMLNTGEQIVGKLRWFDENAFSVVPDGELPFTILRAAVVGYRKHGGEASKPATAAPKREAVAAPVGAAANTEHATPATSEQPHSSISDTKTDDVGSQSRSPEEPEKAASKE
jgi:hypothetical protein